MSSNTQPSPAVEKNVNTADLADVTAMLSALTVEPFNIYYGVRSPTGGIRLTARNYPQFFSEKRIRLKELAKHLPKKLRQSTDYYFMRNAGTAFWENMPHGASSYFKLTPANLKLVVARLSQAEVIEPAFELSPSLDGFCIEVRRHEVRLVLRFGDKSTPPIVGTTFEADEKIVLAALGLAHLKRTKFITHQVLIKREFANC